MTSSEVTFNDEELVKALRWKAGADAKQAADRIEALTADLARSTRLISKMVPLSACGNYVFWDGVGDIELDHNGELRNRIEALEEHVADLLVDLPCGCGYDNPTDVCMKHLPLVRKLTEQLEAARHDAKEAEAYAEGLERDLKTCCMAQVVMDNTVAELERERDEANDVIDKQGALLADAYGAYLDWDEVLKDRADHECKAKLAERLERNALLEARLGKAVEALQGSRETILQLVNSRGSEAEGTDEDWVGDIDTTLAEIEGEKG